MVGQKGKTLGWLQGSGGRDDRRGPPERSQEPVGHFSTSVVTQKAIGRDDADLQWTLEAQEAAGLEKPAELYVDGAYISGAHLTSAIEQNYELVGPAQPTAGRANLPRSLPNRSVNHRHRRAPSDLSRRI